MATRMPTPGSLTGIIDQAMAGDEDAREEVVLRTRAKLERYAGALIRGFGKRGQITVDGVVNRVLAKVLEPREVARKFANNRAFYAYCRKSVFSTIQDLLEQLAAGKRGPSFKHESLSDEGAVPDPEQVDILQKIHRIESLRQLDAEDELAGTVVDRYYTHGLSDREIGLKIGLSRSLVQKKRQMAKLRLTSLLIGTSKS